MKTRNFEIQKQHCFLQGVLFSIFPVTMFAAHFTPPLLSGVWAAAAGAALPLFFGGGAALLFRLPAVGRTLITAGIAGTVFWLFPVLCVNPLFALFTGVTVIASLYYLFSARILPFSTAVPGLLLERFRGSAFALTGMTMFSPLFVHDDRLFSLVCLSGVLTLLGSWGLLAESRKGKKRQQWGICLLLLTLAGAALILALDESIVLPSFFLGAAGICFAAFRKNPDLKYLSIIVEHPGRSLFLTFLLLAAAGTLLLRTSAAMTGELKVIDAAFTAVSAVCVTGLSTIDIARDLTFTGRCFLLLLIQAGGLGIMTLAALLLHALGRLSLNQEQLLSELTPSREQDIFKALRLIVQTTLIIEAAGAFLLSCCFFHIHGNWLKALELGIFTSVSAFCNAGFFPHSANMLPYSGNYLLLIITALLIIAGGIAPAVTVSLFRAAKKDGPLPLVNKLIIGSTLLLLGGSAFLLLLFEWDGIFSGLTPAGKLVNGFFLAASLRTAGFSTVALGNCGVPAVLVMFLCMFAGGTPGGTAGGVKVTTLALLILTLRAAVRGSGEVILDRHRVSGRTVIQAIAIVCAAVLVLFSVIIMLITTQTISTEKVIFESVSALGTVGLSLGGTGELDPVGKVIIMAAMFTGRIGPLTLFLLLSDRRGVQEPGYPPVRIPLG